MNLGPRLRVGAVGAGVILLVAGCTSGAADAPPSSSVASPTASPSVVDPSSLAPSTSSALPSPSSRRVTSADATTSNVSSREAAERAAIESQWKKFWRIYVDIVRTPSDQREQVLDSVSIDPTKSRVLKDASDLEGEGLDNYGDVILNVYQIDLLNDGDAAVLQDCQDQSGFGSLYVESGRKRTVGVPQNHMQAGLIRGDDGVWRVQTLQYVENQPC